MDEKMESFLKEYNAFRLYAEEQQISSSEPTTLQLFAIFRKDERGNSINGRRMDSQPATEKQKAYIRGICEQNGVKFAEEEIEKLTKKGASDIINSFKGGA